MAAGGAIGSYVGVAVPVGAEGPSGAGSAAEAVGQSGTTSEVPMFGELVGRACYQRNGGTATMRFRWSSVGRVQTGTFVYQLFDCTTGHTSAGLTRRLGYETPTGTSGRAEATVKVNPAHKYRMRITGRVVRARARRRLRAGRLLEQRAAPGQPEVAGRHHLRVGAAPEAGGSAGAPTDRPSRMARSVGSRWQSASNRWTRATRTATVPRVSVAVHQEPGRQVCSADPASADLQGRSGRCVAACARTQILRAPFHWLAFAVDIARQSGPPSAAPVFNSARLTHLPPQRRPRRTAGGGATPCAAPEGLRRTRLTRTTAAPAPSTGTRPRPLGRRRANRLLGQSV